MAYQVVYHPLVLAEDRRAVHRTLQHRVLRAIEQRLTTEPAYYGEPLRYRLEGYWRLRVGDYRVIYQIIEGKVLVVAIGHRKEIYSISPGRLLWRP